jgi:esterase/lipase
MKFVILGVFLLFSFMSQASTVFGEFDFMKSRCQNLSLPTHLTTDRYHWFAPAKGQEMKAAALVVHGLNNRPSVMLPLVKELNAQGIAVLNVGLTGYATAVSDLKKVTANDWLRDVFIGNCLLQQKAGSVPLYYVGFSLGGLIGETLMISDLAERLEFEKVLLFSPALRTWDRSRWIRLFSFMGRGHGVISFAPARYAAYRFTPNAAYESLFDLIDFYNENLVRNPQKINVPTLIFIDPQDELVSADGLQEMMGLSDLTRWRLQQIEKGRDAQTWFHHVSIDEQGVGSATWANMLSQIKSFF